MSDTKDPLAGIQEEMEQLSELLSDQKELLAYRKDCCVEMFKRLDELERDKERIEEQISLLRDEISRSVPEVTTDLANVAMKISNKESDLKRLCYGLPKDMLRAGVKVATSSLRVSVNRARVVTEYNGEELLKRMPELEEMYADGDPVVVRRIDPAVLGRLIESGHVDKAVVEKFKIETLERNPSVTIREVEE